MSVKSKTISGLAWTGLAQGIKQTLAFIFTVVLARILEPSDFGLIGMATVFTGFANIINDFGVGRALIQKQNAEQRHYSSAFWFNVALGLVLMVSASLLSPLVASFYERPELCLITMVLSTNFLLSSFGAIQASLLTKELDFRQLAIRDIGAILTGGLVGLGMAMCGFGVWSLVCQSVVSALISTALLWRVSTWRPSFLFDRMALKDIFGFSSNTMIFNVMIYVSRNIDYLLIGKFLGPIALGYYTLAFKLMMYPLQNVSFVIGKVMFPAFSKINFNIEKLQHAYLNTIQAIATLTFPMMTGLFVVASELIVLIYGAKWQPSSTIVQIFCICGLLQTINTTAISATSSLGRADLLSKLAIANVVTAVPAVLFGLRWGIYGIAIMYTFQQVIWIVVCQLIFGKLLQLKRARHLVPIMRIFLISVASAFITFYTKKLINPLHFFGFLATVGAGFLSYCLFLYLFEREYLARAITDLSFLKAKP